MASIHAKGTEIYVDEFDYSGVINTCNINQSRPVSLITSFVDSDDVYVPGKGSFTIELSGLYSTASPAYDGEMFADLTSSDRLITVSPGIATAAGGRVRFGRGDITSMPVIATITAAVALNITWTGSGVLVNGICIHRATALGANANSTAYELGAISTSQKLVAFQHVLGVTGTNPTLDTIIESDSQENFAGSPETQMTFTQATAATSEREIKAGAITDTWYRAGMTVSGTNTPTFNVVIVLGIAPYSA